MGSSQQLFEGVIIMLLMIALAVFLKKIRLLDESASKIFGSLVLKVTLPALIFYSLAVQNFTPELLKLATVVAITEIICIFLAWIIAGIIKLNRAETGALMLVSAFGMSAMLGYPLIREVFPGDIHAIEDAAISSELGVGVILFILGPMIAIHFGESRFDNKAVLSSLKQFIVSPIFISIVLGIVVSFFPIPMENHVVITIKQLLKHLSNANSLLVALTIGLIIETKIPSKVYLFLAVAILLKLILQPVIAQVLGSTLNLPSLQKEVVLIETAMPSAILTAIFAKQYNCKPELVSKAIVATLIISLLSVTTIFDIYF